jgi:hypothetical protein
MWKAVLFKTDGSDRAEYGYCETAELAIQLTAQDLYPNNYGDFPITYRPEDGVIFRNGKPCGVVVDLDD